MADPASYNKLPYRETISEYEYTEKLLLGKKVNCTEYQKMGFDKMKLIGMKLSPHLAQMIHRLVVEPRAHDIKRCHSRHHHHAADHAGTQSHQPAVLWEHLGKKKIMW